MSEASSISLVIFDTGEEIGLWHDYSFASEFLTPTDKFSFAIGGTGLEMRDLKRKLLPGTRVSLIIDGKAQATGYIATVPLRSHRGGSRITVIGYDALWAMVRGGVDPRFTLAEGTTLEDLVVAIGTQYGFTKFATSDIARRSVVTGNLAGRLVGSTVPAKTVVTEFFVGGNKQRDEKIVPAHSILVDPTRPKYLKDYSLKQAQPKPGGEGAYQFVERNARRYELHLWCNELGDTLIVDAADFDQAPSYEIHDDGRGRINHEGGDLILSDADQPTVIIAVGVGGSPISKKTKLKVAMVNELTGLDETGAIRPEVQNVINQAFGCHLLDLRPELIPYGAQFRNGVCRPLYLEDKDSKTFGQLEGFVRHQMAARQSKSTAVRYVMADHMQNGRPWAVNTIVDVHDDVLDIHEPMWIRGRTFIQSRESPGTITQLDLIRRHTLDLGG